MSGLAPGACRHHLVKASRRHRRHGLSQAMCTNKPKFGTFVVLFLSLLFAAASVGASAKVDTRGVAVSALAGASAIKVDARPHSEREWIESKAVEGGDNAPDPALAASFSYPVESPAPEINGRISGNAPIRGAYRQSPPATGPPSA
jgi:hypothetical protein